jgi:hypothetical protein
VTVAWIFGTVQKISSAGGLSLKKDALPSSYKVVAYSPIWVCQ